MAGENVAAPAAPANPGTPGQGQQPPGTPAAPAAPAQPQYYEKKVNGQVRRYTIDELLNKAPLADGAMERFEQAAEIQRKHSSWKETAKKDFMSALQDPELGLTKDQIRSRFESWYKENFIDPETMTAEQREAAQAKRERDEALARLKAREDQEKEMRDSAEKQQLAQQLQADIIKALDGAPDLPKTRFTVSRMAYWMKQNLRRGFDAPMDHVLQQVRDEYAGVNRAGVDAIKDQPEKVGEWIVKTYGMDVLKAIRKLDMAQLRARTTPQNPEQGGVKPDPSAPPVPTNRAGGGNSKSMRDVDAYFNELRRTKK